MVRIWTIARTELLRMLRDRSNIFFVFVFPLLLVVLIGAQFAGSVDARLGVVGPQDDATLDALLERLEAADGVAPVRMADEAALRDEVERGLMSGGILVPDGLDAALLGLDDVEVTFIGRPDATATSLRTLVAAELADETLAIDAVALLDALEPRSPAERDELLAVAALVGGQAPGITVAAQTLGSDELAEEFAGLGQFDLGASTQLFLFTFLTALTGGVALIQTREYGVARRMVATPTPVRVIVAGITGGRLLIALMQALYIVIATVLLFRVDWGDPLAATVVILSFCAVAAAAGLVLGAVFSNDSQASGAGVGLGIGLAALGGSMIPLELFPEGMRAVARLTPHAWANDAMAQIVRRDAGLVEVLPNVGVLVGMALALGVLGTWRLRAVLAR
ncbi:MAG: ABC transporter permease [Nitriliruptoraceae bacterium]|nr:ABC transporter permease [Nitriliruptoraceae bacterium]